MPGYCHRPAGWATGYMYIVHSCSWPLIILFTLQTDSREISVCGKNRMEFKVIHMKWAETSSFGSVDYQLTWKHEISIWLEVHFTSNYNRIDVKSILSVGLDFCPFDNRLIFVQHCINKDKRTNKQINTLLNERIWKKLIELLENTSGWMKSLDEFILGHEG